MLVLGILIPFSLVWAETLEDKISQKADKYGLNPNLITEIIRCESGMNQGIKNKTSKASGYWQFLPSTWESTLKRMNLPANVDVFDGDMNLEVGVWLLKTDGVRHWDSSRTCWQ